LRLTPRAATRASTALADLQLTAAFDVVGAGKVGLDAGVVAGTPKPIGIAVTDRLEAGLENADVLIDFTRPAGTLRHLEVCLRMGTALVIGTTGFSAIERERIAQAATELPIVLAPNMAIGVNVLFKLVDVATRALHQDFDLEVIEAHHSRKVDAPSGTAVKLGEIMAAAMGEALADVAVYQREGHTGERKARSIGFATVRGGDIIGDHTALFAGAGERIEITHRAQSRGTYVQGAFAAARYVVRQPPGLYDMFDVLGLR
jgi:4-hydroxy-tetrahydrodipicolinate reductase